MKVGAVSTMELSSVSVVVDAVDSTVRATAGVNLEGSDVSVSASESVMLSSGPSEGGIVITADAEVGGTVDVVGSGGVRVGAEGAGVQLTGGSVGIHAAATEEQQGDVVLSSATATVASTGAVVIEGGGTDTGVQLSAGIDSSMVLESGTTTAVSATEGIALESGSLSATAASSATVDFH